MPLPQHFNCYPELAQLTKCNSQGNNGNVDDSEESDLSQESKVSHETDSSPEETEEIEHLDQSFVPHSRRGSETPPWVSSERIFRKRDSRYGRECSPSCLHKELKKVLLEYMQWKRAMKKDCTFRKAMETQKELQDSEGFDLLESTELAIN